MLAAGWALLAAAAPPRLQVAAWTQEAAPVLTVGGAAVTAAARPVGPGEQYPPAPHEPKAAPRVAKPLPSPAPRERRAEFKLRVDLSVIADSNRTNGTELETVPIDYGDGPLPVPLDPSLRERSGIGAAAAIAADARLPVAETLAVALDADAYVVDYGGKANDDVSLLVAAGLAFGSGPSPDAKVQLFAFDRWYGGVESLQGFGLRANYRHKLARGQTVRLAVDARIFESGYGEAFDGHEANLSVGYDTVLNPRLSASLGLWAHREWLSDGAFSYSDAGFYGGLSHYLGESFTGGFNAGISRTWFDEPFVRLGPEARHDWRFHASLWLQTRRPVAWGVTPSLTYTYNRTASSIDYYSTERHRLRLGVSRRF